jgi:SAM-dependent methyltransferase
MLKKKSNDLIQNRTRIGLLRKIGLMTTSLRENGLFWTALLLIYYIFSGIGAAFVVMADRIFLKLQRVKISRGLPGTSSLVANKSIWESWDWVAASGDEWTLSEAWKASLIRNVLHKRLPRGQHVLEIGPGAGRWTGVLVEMSGRYTGVDISKSCVNICTRKFGNPPRVSFVLGSGQDLAGIETASIGAVWSFDVFVHVNKREVASYVDELKRVMQCGAIGIVHHGTTGGLDGGWRSDLTTADFHGLLRQADFVIVDCFQSWADGGEVYPVGLYRDAVTIFSKE